MKYIFEVNWELVLKVFLMSLAVILFIASFGGIYLLGFSQGTNSARGEYEDLIGGIVSSKIFIIPTPTPTPIAQKATPSATLKPLKNLTWGGPELWEQVNKSRVEHGVGKLTTKSELCTIASIRLNELLELGKLDSHEGFSNMPERRPDLKWIFEQYNISEFLVQGASSPQEAVIMWLNTLGHSKLLTGGEYVWGCIYAQNSFGVAIAAY